MKIAISFCAAMIGVGAVLMTENFFGVDIKLVRDEPISASIENLEESVIELTTPDSDINEPIYVAPKRSKGSYVAKKLNNRERKELEEKIEKASLDAKRRYELIQSGVSAQDKNSQQVQTR